MQQRKQGIRQRGNGAGTASKVGSTWKARVVIGYRIDENGKRHAIQRSKNGFRTKKDALDYIATLKGQQQRKRHTLAEYWEIWSNDDMLQLSQSKQTAYKGAYKKLGTLVYLDITDITVEQLKKAVSDTCPTYYTARDAKAVLRKLYALADADGAGNPRLPSYIKLPKLDEQEGQAFTQEELRLLWSAYESGNSFVGYILIMVYTGMMPGELIAMRRSCIDLEARQIVGAGIKTKVRKSAPISIAEIIVPVVLALLNASDGVRFVPFSRDTFYARYHEALAGAGVRDLPPYSCRHTTATALAIGAEVAPEVIRKVMRWSTTKMLSRYAHPDRSDALEAVNKLGK